MTSLLRIRSLVGCLPLLIGPALVACSADDTSVTADEEDLTSLSARSRSLQFDGYVYVAPGSSDATIIAAIRKQTQTAFGALRTADIGVNDRELKTIDTSTFKKTTVTVVDTSKPSDPGSPMLKVSYRYSDMAVVPVKMAKRSAITLAVMAPGYPAQSKRVLTECTENDSEAQEFASSLWYVFDPSLGSCQDAIAAEQKAIDTAKAKLADPATQIPKEEATRLYVPTTVSLGADKTNKGKSYPEYDRLYAGGVQKDKLVIGLVNGFIDHGGAEGYKDSGYGEWMEELKESFVSHPDFTVTKIEPAEDFTTFTVNGKNIAGVSFNDFIRWEVDGTGFPAGLKSSDRTALRKAVGDKVIKHWITFDATVNVSIGGAPAKPVTLEIQTYFGAEGDYTPHKRAIKNSDVFIYNGHSYIGYGPLDPSNFSASDFPKSYQILFIDGCVSYNYYEKDYIPLKQDGTKNLELITNGIEAPSWKSGYALGRFVSTLLNGKQANYKTLLQVASETDALRVVDGEVDNVYTPSKTPISFK